MLHSTRYSNQWKTKKLHENICCKCIVFYLQIFQKKHVAKLINFIEMSVRSSPWEQLLCNCSRNLWEISLKKFVFSKTAAKFARKFTKNNYLSVPAFTGIFHGFSQKLQNNHPRHQSNSDTLAPLKLLLGCRLIVRKFTLDLGQLRWALDNYSISL